MNGRTSTEPPDDDADDVSGGDDGCPGERSQRYPDNEMPIAGAARGGGAGGGSGDGDHHDTDASDEFDEAGRRYQRFCDAREEFLLDYRYNTARAYWGDLDEIWLWCERREFDIFELTGRQFRQYLGLLRRQHYSENTIRRRKVSLGLFRQSAGMPLNDD